MPIGNGSYPAMERCLANYFHSESLLHWKFPTGHIRGGLTPPNPLEPPPLCLYCNFQNTDVRVYHLR